jgi:hypothetical protein
MDALLLGQPTASGSTVVTPLRKHSGAVHFGFLQFRLNVLVMVHLLIMTGVLYCLRVSSIVRLHYRRTYALLIVLK